MSDFVFHYWILILFFSLIVGIIFIGIKEGIFNDNWSFFQGNLILIPVIIMLIVQINNSYYYRDKTILYLMQEQNLTEKDIKEINSTKYPYIKEILIRKYLELKQKELK